MICPPQNTLFQAARNCIFTDTAFPAVMRYIIAPSRRAGWGLGVGFMYLTQSRTAVNQPWGRGLAVLIGVNLSKGVLQYTPT